MATNWICYYIQYQLVNLRVKAIKTALWSDREIQHQALTSCKHFFLWFKALRATWIFLVRHGSKLHPRICIITVSRNPTLSLTPEEAPFPTASSQSAFKGASLKVKSSFPKFWEVGWVPHHGGFCIWERKKSFHISNQTMRAPTRSENSSKRLVWNMFSGMQMYQWQIPCFAFFT